LNARQILSLFCLSALLWMPLTVLAEEETTTATAESEERDWGYGGLVLLSNSVGRGTFIGDEFNARPSWNMLLSVRPKFTISKKHNLIMQLRFDMNQTLVDNADTTAAVPNEFLLYDIRLGLYYNNFVDLKDVGLKLSAWGEFFFPTSKLSQLQTKILGLRLGLKTSYKPLDWMSITFSSYATKNFNRYTNYVLDEDDFSIPLVARAGGAESVESGLVANGLAPSEWFVTNAISVGFTFLEKFNATVGWTMLNAFSYADHPIDELSSPHAVAGRGRADLMYGTIEVGYGITDNVSVSLGSTVEQSPKTADNQSFRFPFWDTTNGAANRQSFYLDVAGSF